jgi:AraC family transcriptional regulator of adaptative response/methylated-DNA-[protein]-cysteine methyltransferase
MNQTMNFQEQSADYQRIAQAIRYLDQNFQRQPSLDEMAASVHLSKYHFQRLFKRWAGVTPTQFLHYLTLEYAKERLQESSSLFDTALDAGLSGSGRLHDLFVNFEAMTPGQYKEQGQGLIIYYGVHPTPFGPCLLGQTERGVCALRFISSEDGAGQALSEIKKEWPKAQFIERPDLTETAVNHIFSDTKGDDQAPIHLSIKGTNFQVQVWQALLAIPTGMMVTYQDVAHKIGAPTATRAVAGAIGRNPAGYIIPCHRVISKTGQTHGYRWGATRKKALLAYEAGQTSNIP